MAASAAVAVLWSLLPHAIEMAALRRITPAVFGVMMSSEPVVAAGVGLLLLGEQMRAAQWSGIGLVVVACAGVARGSRADAVGDRAYAEMANGGVQRCRQDHTGFPDVGIVHVFPSRLPTDMMTRQNAFRTRRFR
ncbi:EamA family transporter [Nocardia sp. NPDC004260]